MTKRARTRLLTVLIFGIFAVSTASIFVRFALNDGVPPLIIAAYRLTFAALLLTPIVLPRYSGELRRLARRTWQLALLSGVFLGLHFATWISSLAYTTITASAVLVDTGPIWVALASWLILRERLTRPIVAGLIITVIGSAIVGIADSESTGLGNSQVWGDFLALAGAWFVAGYLIIGRQLRDRLSLSAYIYIVYGAAAVVLIFLALLSGASFTQQANGMPFPQSAFGWMVLLAIFPQLIGHSALNYALRFLPPTYVAIVTLAEPIGTSVLAFVLLQEVPSPLTLVGAGVILIGIGVASFPLRSRSSSTA
jgi:drug/metabolite transporter (DMT)-like permease